MTLETFYQSEIHIDMFDDKMEIYSPGGMPDGTFIQDRDPLTVPSTRRNPLLADIFERLGYMERRGSGFGKIIRSYEVQVNYQEGKRPFFRSDRTQFTVILPNLNYGVITQDTTQVATQDTAQVTPQIQRLLDAIGDDTVSTQELMARCAKKNRSYFGKEYLRPALKAGLIEMTIPGKHNSRQQKYRKRRSE